MPRAEHISGSRICEQSSPCCFDGTRYRRVPEMHEDCNISVAHYASVFLIVVSKTGLPCGDEVGPFVERQMSLGRGILLCKTMRCYERR
ncbi:MAG: hypothetical protein FLDDKLPJ_03333 [Phycisphaerae bacterium]|nr:hypothetical protein [Phycisphaerae bacterium]